MQKQPYKGRDNFPSPTQPSLCAPTQMQIISTPGATLGESKLNPYPESWLRTRHRGKSTETKGDAQQLQPDVYGPPFVIYGRAMRVYCTEQFEDFPGVENNYNHHRSATGGLYVIEVERNIL